MIKGWKHLRFWKSPAFDKICNEWNHWCHPQKILPNPKLWFRALELTPFEGVKCVILGQEPYTRRGWSDGLAFSVHPHVSPLPKPLDNIFAEYRSDLGFRQPSTGSLEPWARNGVLLLNSVLTVEEGRRLRHAGRGWEKLTYEIIRDLGERNDCVFVLWGKKAEEYSAGLRSSKVIVSAHPSPMSARQGFFGSRPFSRVNEYLREMNQDIINWRLP